jgi:tetratricopeptide (TPR) repeat protein
MLSNPSQLPRVKALLAVLVALLFGHPGCGQRTAPSGEHPRTASWKFRDDPVLVKVSVVDARGLPLDGVAHARLYSIAKPDAKALDLTADTQTLSIADFKGVPPGDYELEVTSVGFKKSAQHMHVMNDGNDFGVFVYMHSESDPDLGYAAKSGTPVNLKSMDEIVRGLAFLQKKQYEKAGGRFTEATRIAPESPEAWCWLGETELDLHRKDAARKNFKQALALEPDHENALLGLAEMHLEAGETTTAMELVERAYRTHGAGWRTQFLLASAYAQANRLPEAETHAVRAADFPGRDTVPAIMLLADVLCREGKNDEARLAWERVLKLAPSSTSAKEAKERIAKVAGESNEPSLPLVEGLSFAPAPEVAAPSSEELPWAPPDVDSREYSTASDVTCRSDEVLDFAAYRLSSQLLNFEKFTATEHVVHQAIERSGVPEPAKEKQFSYIVFVSPYAGNSLYLEESRDGGSNYSAFPTSMVTVGLNSLGVALLQPVNREGFVYQCEGLTSVRGQAAWQIRFEEKKDTAVSIRRWRNNNNTYNIRVKGRVWLTSASYDMLRIETDLLEPVRQLGLTRDHLQVNYGPVSFQDGTQWLWLPWSAEMHMEYRHRRFHHQHFLTDYMLFNVDTTEKVSNPKVQLPQQVDPSQ